MRDKVKLSTIAWACWVAVLVLGCVAIATARHTSLMGVLAFAAAWFGFTAFALAMESL